MGEYLKRDTALQILDLGYNRLEDDGAKYIAEALMLTNTNLKRLSIKSNNISSEGLCAISDSLGFNTSLTHIYIWGNHLEEAACFVSC